MAINFKDPKKKNTEKVETSKVEALGKLSSMVSLPSFVRAGTAGIDREDDLVSLVIKGLSSIRDNTRNDRLHARDAGLCQRRTVLSSKQTGQSVETPASKAYYKIGSTIEDIVLTSLYESGALLFKNYRLPDIGINLGGYIDGVILLNEKIRVLEIKSCGELPDVPKDEHSAQALMYSAVTGLPATVLYFSRQVAKYNGTMLIRQFDLDDNDGLARTALWRAVYGHLAIKEGFVPDRPTHMKRDACGFCPFIPYCWEGQDLEVEMGTPIDYDDHYELVSKTNDLIDGLMSQKSIVERRTGILKHLSHIGNDHAKKLLVGKDWQKL